VQTKICTKCKNELPLDSFYEDSRYKSGRACHCKACIAKYNKQYAITNREKIIEYHRNWQRANKDKVRLYHRRVYAKRKGLS
jgi:hypothetical protein